VRVLLTTIGSRGDVQPLVALALHLKSRGDEPRVCAPPDFREWIDGLGLPFTPLGPEVRSFSAARPIGTTPKPSVAPLSPLSHERRQQMAEATVVTQFETLAAAAENADVVLAASALQIAARSIAERRGIPYAFAAYAPNVLPSPHHAPPALPPVPGDTAPPTDDVGELWARDARRFNDLFGPALNRQRARLGLPTVADVRTHVFTSKPWLAADPTLGPWPDPEAGVIQTGAWILADDRPLSRDLQGFLDAGEPPIYFGFGSTAATPELGQAMLQAARAAGRRAIISQGWFDGAPVESGADCLAIGDTNLLALFPRVAAAVHHGGAGTTTAVALGGAPQVIVPTFYDQPYWAQQVERLGIGVAHGRGAPTAASLTHALEAALRPAVAARARSVATAVRRDGVEVAARQLDTLDRST
jgi:vancomycin aglycone glucosyltransferase